MDETHNRAVGQTPSSAMDTQTAGHQTKQPPALYFKAKTKPAPAEREGSTFHWHQLTGAIVVHYYVEIGLTLHGKF